ncbi:MAG: SpoIIE family protein phosphatase [Spirochaetaceae bacterium]
MDILIAEDSLTSRKLLKSILIKMSFNVIETVDGLDAWNKLEDESPPRIALIDWMMPNLSGIDLIKKIRLKEKDTGLYTYIIMVTSNTDEKYADIGFAAGADDFIPKPIDPKALSIRLKIARRIINQQKQLYNVQLKLADQLFLQKDAISKAQEIQQVLNSKELPLDEQVNIRALYNPSEEMGGDFFNIIKTNSGNIATIIVDCTGHGLEASMYATLLKSVCDRHISLLDIPLHLATFVEMVNIDIQDYITSDQYPVMFVSVYDSTEMKFYYCSANGEHPYLIRNGEAELVPRAPGMHLGYDEKSSYHVKSIDLKNNDILFFYSDAIIEIKDASWERSNDKILRQQLCKMGNNLKKDNDDIMRFVNKTTGTTILDDDLSLIYMQVKTPLVYNSVINSIKSVPREIEVLRQNLISYDYEYDDCQQALIAYNELLVNAVVHGNKENTTLSVNIQYLLTCKDITINIEDQGSGFNQDDIPDPTDFDRLSILLESDNEEAYSHGRGVWMIKRFMDEVVFENGGSLASVVKNKKKINTLNNYRLPIDIKKV